MPVYLAGMTVSPKTGELCLVWWRTASTRRARSRIDLMSECSIAALSGEYIGGGEIESGYSPEQDSGKWGRRWSQPAIQITGLPRAHTSEGLIEEVKDQGFGTALYCGLVACTKLSVSDPPRTGSVWPVAAGVCSKPMNRSDEAEAWWNRAKERGLAHITSGPFVDVVEAEAGGTGSEFPAWLDVESIVTSYRRKWVDRLRRARTPRDRERFQRALDAIPDVGDQPRSWQTYVQFEKNAVGEADVLTFDSAWERNIIVAQATQLPPALRAGQLSIADRKLANAEEVFGMVNKDAIAAANYAVLNQYGDKGKDAMNRMVSFAKNTGISSDDVGKMVERYNSGADIEWPKRGRVQDEGFGRVRTRRMRRNPADFSIVLYGARPNPDAKLEHDMYELAEKRQELGWDGWADDDS